MNRNTVTVLAAPLAEEAEDEDEDTRGLSAAKDDVSRAASNRDEGSGDAEWYRAVYAPDAS